MPIEVLEAFQPRTYDGTDNSAAHAAGPVAPSGSIHGGIVGAIKALQTKVNEIVTDGLNALPLTATVLAEATELTIASGEITVTQNYHTVDTESDAASDDLDVIAGGEVGSIIVLRPANDARSVVLQHSATIICPYAQDITLAEDDDHAMLLKVSETAWAVIATKLASPIVQMTDNQAIGWQFAEGATAYLTFITTNSSERIVAAKRLTVTDAVASGTERVVGGVAATNPAASTAITGATETQTNFSTAEYTIPANTLKVGTVVRVKAWGRYTVTTAAEVHVFGIAYGATNLCVTGNIDPADNQIFDVEFEFSVRSVGAAGTITGVGRVNSGGQASVTGVVHFLATGTAGTSTTQIDTTASTILSVFLDRQASAADGDSMRLDGFVVSVHG